MEDRRTRYFAPAEFETDPNPMTPDELRAYQASFDAEIAQRQAPPVDVKHLRSWGIPLALIVCIALWTLFGMWLTR